MNQFKTHILCFLAMIAIAYPAQTTAQDEDVVWLTEHFADSLTVDSTEISLVTCEPHQMVYALYGHTGLRINDLSSDMDLLANWGIFELKKKFFVPRFIFGLTDYKMDIETWEGFCARYTYYGCGIYEQTLNLEWSEKRKLIDAILENYKPENRLYRYNFFYDNCTTRPRDLIKQCIDGQITYPEPESRLSWRQLVHQWNGTHLWARWGNDILLGINADKKTTQEEAQFLPDNLRKDFANATITSTEGTSRQLVEKEQWTTPPLYDKGENSFLDEYVLSPLGVAMLLFIMLAVVEMAERRIGRRLWQFDAMLLLTSGIIGLVLFVMIFSQHPTVSLNFQILIFNPLALLFMPSIIKKMRKGEKSKALNIIIIMIVAGIILGFSQNYAEGVLILALILLTAYIRSSFIKTNAKK